MVSPDFHRIVTREKLMSRLIRPALIVSVIAMVAFVLGIFASRQRNRHDTIETAIDLISKHQKERDGSEQGTVEKRLYGSREQENAERTIREKWADTIRQLIKMAAQDVKPLSPSDPENIRYPWHDSKHLSILLIGDMRSAEAIPVLLDNLGYRNPAELAGSYLGIGGLYPAAEALSKIGMPAVGPVIDKLASYPPKSQGSEICCWILREILGARLARVRLEIAIEESHDPAVKERLAAVLPYFKTDQEKAAEERARREKAGKQEPMPKTEK
jgi:hypothetical protein